MNGRTPHQLFHCLLITLAVCGFGATAARAQRGAGDIRAVDFQNFTYRNTSCGPGAIRARGGKFEKKTGEYEGIYFSVEKVVYGDLDGDGRDEAAVFTLCNTGGTGQFTESTVFTMRGGRAVPLVSTGIGDRADGGVHDVRIAGGRLVEERYGHGPNSGACCPEFIETTNYGLRGRRLVKIGRTQRKKYTPTS